MEFITAELILYIIIGIIAFDYIFERILDYLNSTYWSDELPEELSDIYEADKYKKSQQYLRVKQRFSLLVSSISFIAMILMLVLGGFAFLDQLTRSITPHPILMALLYFGILGLAADILSTPFSIYNTFVIEERFGFNKTTVRTFILDKFKGLFLGLIIGGGLLSLIVWIYISTGAWFWLIAWIVVSVFMIFMTMFYSNVIVPLFNKQKPLESGELREAIESYASRVKFRLKNIFVLDGSRRSSKANAYFAGLGRKKRIVLYDTLINDLSNPELVAVLAHEVGHYKKKHTLIGMIYSIIQTGVMLFILSLFLKYPVLSEALGAEHASFHMGVIAFAILYSPLSFVIGLLANIMSRKHEYEADRYAGVTDDPEALKMSLKKLSVNNLSNLRPHPAYVFFHYSHPPLLQRMEALDKLNISSSPVAPS